MATWNIKEETDKMYVYCSKNAVSDVAASNYFGKAAGWVSGGSYAVGDRVTSSSIQYRNKTGVNTSTAPASDSTNWEFDFENYQPYSTSRSYLIGHKTNYNNEHYICSTNTTGTFNPLHWSKQIISNKDVPYKLKNTALNMMYADARFVSNEVFDYVNNVHSVDANLLISNGIWNETLSTPTKIVKIIGQSKWKTRMECFSANYGFNNFRFKNLNFSVQLSVVSGVYTFVAENCIFYSIYTYSSGGLILLYMYKNIIKNVCYGGTGLTYLHFVNNTILSVTGAWTGTQWRNNSVFKNNYFKGIFYFGVPTALYGVNIVPIGNIDYNSFEGNCNVNGVSQTSLAMLQATLPNQNISSSYGAVTLNSDYTLPVGSPLINAGSNRNHIGAEGIGYPETTSTILDTANGAIYKNVVKYGSTLIREQISKQAQAGSNNTITLESSASSSDGHYNTFRIYISTGTGSGQTRTIIGYDGTTKIATVNTNWTTNPDSTSIYEILDGEITSAVGDLGSIQIVKKLLMQTTNYYDVTNTIINQSASRTDARLDKPSALTFDMRWGNSSDLSAVAYVRFVQDDYLKIDNAGKGCGDADYNPANVQTSLLSFRYYQIKINLIK